MKNSQTTLHQAVALVAALAALATAACGGADDANDPSAPAPTTDSAVVDPATGDGNDVMTGDTDFADPAGDDGSRLPAAGVIDFPFDDPSAPAEVPTVPGAPTPPSSSSSAPSWVSTALAHPNKFFKRQVRHPTWNPTGPLFSGNCAPTSLAMIAKVFGKEPAGLTIEQSIDRVRVMMNKPSDSGGASSAQVRLGASRLGLHYRAMAKGELDSELAKKHMVVLAGYPGRDGTDAPSLYQSAFRAAGYYYTFDQNHSIAVFGKTAAGRYVVADPLSKIGVITMSSAQMHDYWARWGGSGTAVWR